VSGARSASEQKGPPQFTFLPELLRRDAAANFRPRASSIPRIGIEKSASHLVGESLLVSPRPFELKRVFQSQSS
jgi:hypothetical protein